MVACDVDKTSLAWILAPEIVFEFKGCCDRCKRCRGRSSSRCIAAVNAADVNHAGNDSSAIRANSLVGASSQLELALPRASTNLASIGGSDTAAYVKQRVVASVADVGFATQSSRPVLCATSNDRG